MKILNPLFFCLFMLFFFSCTEGAKKKSAETDNDRVKTEENDAGNTHEISSEEENFDQFISNFSVVESFQLERIKFPICVTIPDDGHEGMPPTKEIIDRYNWEMLDLTYDSTFLTRPYDQYYQVVRSKNDTVVVEIRGINNGIYADYYFKLIAGKWYLVTLYEASF